MGCQHDINLIYVNFRFRYWYLRVAAHARANHWPQLEAFSRSKKAPPIGFEAFAEEFLEQGNQIEGRKYVNRV